MPNLTILGTITNGTCSSQNTGLGWYVTVGVDLVPAAGEVVALLEGGTAPHASVRNAADQEIGKINLTKGTGNHWTGSDSVFSQPHSVKFRCRFVSDLLEAPCGC